MSDGRKKIVVGPWIVTILAWLPVLYVLSFGPACWITSRMNSGGGVITVFYAPIAKCLSSRHDGLRSTVSRVSKFGAAQDWTWRPDDEIAIQEKTVMPERWKWCNRYLNAPIEERRMKAFFDRIRDK